MLWAPLKLLIFSGGDSALTKGIDRAASVSLPEGVNVAKRDVSLS